MRAQRRRRDFWGFSYLFFRRVFNMKRNLCTMLGAWPEDAVESYLNANFLCRFFSQKSNTGSTQLCMGLLPSSSISDLQQMLIQWTSFLCSNILCRANNDWLFSDNVQCKLHNFVSRCIVDVAYDYNLLVLFIFSNRNWYASGRLIKFYEKLDAKVDLVSVWRESFESVEIYSSLKLTLKERMFVGNIFNFNVRSFSQRRRQDHISLYQWNAIMRSLETEADESLCIHFETK